MKVSELIKYLERCDPDYPVVDGNEELIEFVIQRWELTCEDDNRVLIF